MRISKSRRRIYVIAAVFAAITVCAVLFVPPVVREHQCKAADETATRLRKERREELQTEINGLEASIFDSAPYREPPKTSLRADYEKAMARVNDCYPRE